jgi:glycosyltransferase involved in cell wall biosynthesis
MSLKSEIIEVTGSSKDSLKNNELVDEPTVSVVIAAPGNAAELSAALLHIPEWVHEVLVVTYDRSEILSEAALDVCPGVREVKTNTGDKMSALRKGYDAARGDIIVTFDAASEMSPAVTGKLVRAVRNGADFATGSRFLYKSKSGSISLPRRWGNTLLVRSIHLLYGGYYTDPSSSVCAFWKHVLPRLNLDKSHRRTGLLGANLLINVQALRARLKIAEVPIKVGEEARRDREDRREHHMPKVSVVIPALDEADNLPHVLPRIPEWVHEILLVDGFSTDGTIEVAKRIRPDIRIVHQNGQGKGAALRSGFAAAKGDIVVMMDADGSTDPSEIGLFVRELRDGADFVKGSRFLLGGGTADMPRYRQLGNWGLVTLANTLFVTHYSDITYGYNATWRRYQDELALDIDDWACEIITNIRAANNGLLVVEVPSFENERIAGEAKLEAFSAGWMILKAILCEWKNKVGSIWLLRKPPVERSVTEERA